MPSCFPPLTPLQTHVSRQVLVQYSSTVTEESVWKSSRVEGITARDARPGVRRAGTCPGAYRYPPNLP